MSFQGIWVGAAGSSDTADPMEIEGHEYDKPKARRK